MSQDSKINAETHSLLFGDQQKPKQIQMHIPHKNNNLKKKNIHEGKRGCSQEGGTNTWALMKGAERQRLWNR